MSVNNRLSDEMYDYFDRIDLSPALIEKIRDLFRISSYIVPETIIDIFISDFFSSDGQREYENVWFFTKSFAIEVHNLVKSDTMDCISIHQGIMRWFIEHKDYDFRKSTLRSRLFLRVDFTQTITGDFKASGRNCEQLQKILTKYVAGNLLHIDPPAATEESS